MKKVFLMWPDKDIELVALMRALNTPPHQLLYWLAKEGTEPNNQPGVIFHANGDALMGIAPPEIDATAFPPPSEEFIKKFYRVESVVMTMLNRNFDTYPPDERRHFYYNLLGYWDGVLRKYKPDVLVYPVIPHGAHDYIPYELARHYGIKTIMFEETRVSDRLLSMNDLRVGSDALHKRIEANRGKSFKLTDLSPDIQEYYEKRAVKDKNAAPSYVGFIKNKYSVWYRYSPAKIGRSIVDGSIFGKAYRLFFIEKNFDIILKPLRAALNALRPNLVKEYRALQVVPDMEKKFIYAALQVQPERSTSPLADMFVDQIFAIETLAAATPDDWVIYVKEHPLQWVRIGVEYSSNRYPGYYKRLAAIPKVKLISPDINSFTLMDKSQATMTVAGAPGWEAVLRKKPSIIFGNPWYKEAPGVFRVSDVESCKSAIQKIAAGYREDMPALMNYLKSFDEATIHGYIAASNQSASKLSRKENMQSIMRCILEEIA